MLPELVKKLVYIQHVKVGYNNSWNADFHKS